MKKIVIASDAFKGSVTSLEVADSAERAILRVFPRCDVVKLSIADGGEGTVDALIHALGGKRVACRAHDPLMENLITVEYGLLADGQTAVVEMAAASGLPLVPVERRDPTLTSTFGLGEVIGDALERGCRQFLMGIGGSATNDAGTGMLQALGFRFLDGEGRELGRGGRILGRVRTIDTSRTMPQLATARFTLACDVDNPFSGKNGAAYVFARQKGADDTMIRALDDGLRNFAAVIRERGGMDLDTIPGSGAAGGLGGGCLALLSTTLKPGIEMVLDALDFDRRIAGADLVITGEGRMDRQTLMGKAPYGVLRHASRQGIPVLAIAGAVEDEDLLNTRGFQRVRSIQHDAVTLAEAMEKERTMRNIEKTVEREVRRSD
ncbi:MAG: glycerate kinase [Mediterranea sp.]|nr:glycerate kinase [Mediterranea sp.]